MSLKTEILYLVKQQIVFQPVMPPKKLQPVHLSATEDGGFFDIHGETFTIRQALKQRGGRGMKTDEGFRWRFPNKAYPEVMEFLNEGAENGKLRLGDIDEIDPDAEGDEVDSEPEPAYFSLAKASSSSQAGSAPDIMAELAEIKELIKTNGSKSQTSSNKEDKATITRLSEELAATEEAAEAAKANYDRVMGKLANFIKLLNSKGDDEFPASKLAENLRKIK